MDATSLTDLSTIKIKEGSELADYSFIHAQSLKELLLGIKFDKQASKKGWIDWGLSGFSKKRIEFLSSGNEALNSNHH